MSLLCDRGQHGDEQTEFSKDVEDRKDLRPGAGRVEVSVGNTRDRVLKRQETILV
jgi:hypothetical protein